MQLLLIHMIVAAWELIMSRKITTEIFIKDAQCIHGDKYNYSRVQYITNRDKVKIICNKCDLIFEQRPDSHIEGRGCPKCGGSEKYTTESFVEKAKQIHNNKYIYDKVNYINGKYYIEIICPKHTSFFQRGSHHLKGQGCPKCRFEATSKIQVLSQDEFIKRAKEIHGNRYNYSLVEYTGMRDKIKIICREHGTFNQEPNNHLKRHGCPKCNLSKGESAIEKWLQDNKIDFEPFKRFDDCRHIKPLPFDFYLPDYNLIIEFDGAQHFIQGNNYFKQNLADIQYRDSIKNEYCKNNNITLLRIPYTKLKEVNKILFENVRRI